jgi:hypothetical protein
MFAAITIAVVVVATIVTTVVLLNGSGRSQEQAAPATTSTTPTSTTPSSPESSPTSAPAGPPPKPVVPGWQAVAVPKRSAAYDVPPDWTVEPPDRLVGFGEPRDAVTMRGVAEYQKGFCPGQSGSFRASTGTTARKGASDNDIALATAQKLADLVYSVHGQRPAVEMGPARPVDLAGNSLHGVLVTAKVTHPSPGPCDSPTALISVLASNHTNDGSVVHIGIADQGVPGSLPPETLNTIMTSLRPN